MDADNHWIGNYQVTEHHLNSGSWDWWFCLIFLYLWYILQFLWLIGNVVSIVFNLSHFIMSSKYQTTDTIIKVLHNSWDLRLNIFLSLKRQNYTIFSTYWHKHSFFQKHVYLICEHLPEQGEFHRKRRFLFSSPLKQNISNEEMYNEINSKDRK